MADPDFPCTGCGQCCIGVNKIPNFPYPTYDGGHCIHLDNKKWRCGIYSRRPPVCRIDVGVAMIKQGRVTVKGHTLEESSKWSTYECHKYIAGNCNKLVEKAGLPDKFRVVVNKEDYEIRQDSPPAPGSDCSSA